MTTRRVPFCQYPYEKRTECRSSYPHRSQQSQSLSEPCPVSAVINNADVYGIPAPQKLVIDHILHNVSGVKLAAIQLCIPKADVRIIVFIRIVEISLSFDIVSLRQWNQERVDNMLHIIWNQRGIDIFVSYGGYGVRNIGGIGKRADLRNKKIQNVVQNILPLDAVALYNVLTYSSL